MQEERLRAVLPFLRPRTEEPTGIVLLLFIVLCIGILGLVALHFWRKRTQRLDQEARFAKLGDDKGLDRVQCDYLVRLAWQHRMNNPLLLLTSAYAFDRIVGRRAAELVDTPNEAELETIGAIRAALGFDQLPSDQPLRTTRQFATGLNIMVWHEAEEAFYPWMLVGRDERGLTIAPLFREDYARFADLQTGDTLTARIWREEDTEYRFQASILDIDPGSLIATLRHDDAIERLQQRDFYRLDVQFDIVFSFYAESESEEKEGSEAAPPIVGQVLNLSAGGLSAVVDRPVPPGVQLQIDRACNDPFPLGGLVCEVVQGQIGENATGSTSLQLRFAELTPARESELVRRIYQYQTGGDAMPADGQECPGG